MWCKPVAMANLLEVVEILAISRLTLYYRPEFSKHLPRSPRTLTSPVTCRPADHPPLVSQYCSRGQSKKKPTH